MIKDVIKIIVEMSTKDIGFITEKACFSTHYVDILCTKRVENVVEI